MALSDQNTAGVDDDKLYIHERWNRMIEMLHVTKVTSVEQFSSALGVSPATIRRDLNELHSDGRLRRVRGGAIAAEPNAAYSDPYFGLSGQMNQAENLTVNIKEKRAIGKIAASMIDDNPLLVQNEQQLIERADKVILLADSSKFEAKASLSVCGLERIDVVVTDRGLSDEARKMLVDNDIEIVIAKA